MYVSVVNLISTTANNEATTDIHSNNTFSVTTQHTNVKVSFIDDAVLWNCRDQSVTRSYYRILYLMLIGSFSFALVTLTIVKWKILCSAEHSYTYLWRIAVVHCIWDKVGELTANIKEPAKDETNTEEPNLTTIDMDAKKIEEPITTTDITGGYEETCDKSTMTMTEEPKMDVAARYYQLLEDEDISFNVPIGYNGCRLFTLFINSLILPIALFLCFTTYDLHPFSCIPMQEEKYIEYSRTKNANTGTVEIQFPDWIKAYRIAAIILLFLFGFIFLISTICFHACNFKIVEQLKGQVKERI